MSDYIPIGANAENVETNDGVSVENILNKTPYYYNSVADMKADTDLAVGDMAVTLGYYSVNDGGAGEYRIVDGNYTDDGGSYHELENGFFAELVISNDWINVKQCGAYGNGTNDDTLAIQNAINIIKNVYIPEGIYIVSSTINLPFNIHIKGMNVFKTKIKSTIDKNYTFIYGNDYDYNGLEGVIENIQITSNNSISEKPYGIYLYSSIALKKVRFHTIGKCIERVWNYIDNIILDNVTIGYCIPNGEYLVNLSGNNDGLYINQLKVASWTGDTTKYNGMYLNRCHGGTIKSSILNWNMTIENCNAINIQGCHMENSWGGYYIKDSDVTIQNCFKWKNNLSSGSDIILENEDYSRGNSIQLSNCCFYLSGAIFNNYGLEGYGPEIQIANNTILSIDSCFKEINTADNNRTLLSHYGIYIQDSSSNLLDDFNNFSYQNSINSKINYIDESRYDIQSNINYNEDRTEGQGIGAAALSNNIQWLGDSHSEWHYKVVSVIDEVRKLRICVSNDSTVENIIQNEKGLNIALNGRYTMSNVHVFSGASVNNYTKETIIPICMRNVLLDNGYQISGYLTKTVSTTNGYSLYTKVNKYIKEGKNVIVWLNSIPTKGIWTIGDKVINTQIGLGNPISWIYDGTNWICEGYYENSSI